MKILNNYRTFLIESKTISEDSEEYQENISVDIQDIFTIFSKASSNPFITLLSMLIIRVVLELGQQALL